MHHLISGINFLSHFASLAQNTLLMTSHSLIHLPPTHHSYPPSHIHCSIPGSKLTFSTNLFHHSLLAPIEILEEWCYYWQLECMNELHILWVIDSISAATWTAFSDYTGPDLLCSMVLIFNLSLIFSFYFGSCGRLSWLNCQLSSAR